MRIKYLVDKELDVVSGGNTEGITLYLPSGGDIRLVLTERAAVAMLAHNPLIEEGGIGPGV